MNGDAERRDYMFAAGVLTGTLIGMGLALWLAPRSAEELRRRVSESAKRAGRLASERYQDVSSRMSETMDEFAQKGQDLRNSMADAVARGAREVERRASAAKAVRDTDGPIPFSGDRPASAHPL